MTVCASCKAAGKLLASGPADLVRELHGKCPGGTHCDCQHEAGRSVLREDRGTDPRRGG